MMKISEDEAPNRICPIRSNKRDTTYCAGSECMAWRRANSIFKDPCPPLKVVTTAPNDLVDVRRGFCGLAGPPTE